MEELDEVEARVLGCLLEKELAVPQQYPLTLNALLAACNQTTNRDPVVTYDEATVAEAAARLKDRRLVRFVHPSHGRSALRYRQVLDEVTGLDATGRAVVGMLLVRGPQTAAELRARTERLAPDDGDVSAVLDELAGATDPMVRRLPRQPGQKEERWVQLLTGEPAPDAGRAAPTAGAGAGEGLRDQVAALRAEVAEMRRELDELRAGLGG